MGSRVTDANDTRSGALLVGSGWYGCQLSIVDRGHQKVAFKHEIPKSSSEYSEVVV